MKATKRVPLETMLKNMCQFDDEADEMHAELKKYVAENKPAKRAPRAQHDAFMDKVFQLMSKMRECRLDAQRCAVDAAPFMHQRLAAVAVTVEDKTIRRIHDETAMSDDELADYYNQLRLRPTSVKPMMILDNETGEPVGTDENEA